jgi:hypothetical protein
MHQTLAYKRRAHIYWRDADHPSVLPLGTYGLISQGFFALPPAFFGITLSDGLWDEINAKVGSNLEEHEDEIIPARDLERAIKVVEDFYTNLYIGKQGEKTVIAGKQISPEECDIIAKMSYSELEEFTKIFISFLKNSAKHNKDLVFSL